MFGAHSASSFRGFLHAESGLISPDVFEGFVSLQSPPLFELSAGWALVVMPLI